jgi:hypothetical protein
LCHASRRALDLARRGETQETAEDWRVAGLCVWIDSEYDLLPIQNDAIKAARGEIPAPFGKVIEFTDQQLLARDIHAIALAVLIKAFD